MLIPSIGVSSAGQEGSLAVSDIVMNHVKGVETRIELRDGLAGYGVNLTNDVVDAVEELR